MSSTDPRWGQEGRDRKAEAILATLRLHCSQDLHGGIWLDIGCGSGEIAATLAQHVERVVGVDPEPWERWQSYHKQHANLDFHVGSYRDLETLLGVDSCAVIVCNQVYEHVDDPKRMLDAIRRILTPDGVCYFAGPNLLWPIEPHVFWPFVHWLPRSFAQRCMRILGSKRAHDLDAWSWSYWKMTHQFRQSGLTYVSVVRERLRAAVSARHPVLSHALACVPRRLTTILTPLGPAFAFVLRKRND